MIYLLNNQCSHICFDDHRQFHYFSTNDECMCAFIVEYFRLRYLIVAHSHNYRKCDLNAAYPAVTAVKTRIYCLKITNTQSKCSSINSVSTSLTERNSSRGKTRWRSKKWAILVVRSYSAIFAPMKRKRKYVAAGSVADFFLYKVQKSSE